MIRQTDDKWLALKAWLNTWIKAHPDYITSCIETAQTNKELQKIAYNEFAATKSKTMRWALSIPPIVYRAIQLFEQTYSVSIFGSKKDLHRFMKEYPQFTVPKRV